jgi:hypothetical protein
MACLVWTWNLPLVAGVDAYWQAGLRVREGQPLYLDYGDPNATLAYRYAPWFAWIWAVLTFLPQSIVYATWRVLLVGAVLWTLWRQDNAWVIAAAGPVLTFYALGGNVHPLLVAGLLYGGERRSGPIWIGLAASLKAVPIFFALVYLGRRQWVRLGLSLLTTAILVAPMLAYDLSSFQGDPGPSLSLYYLAGQLVWLGVAAAAIAVAVVRPSWLTAGIAVIAAIPRLLLYDFAFLLVRPDLQPLKDDQDAAER